jgi:hypothetical protein
VRICSSAKTDDATADDSKRASGSFLAVVKEHLQAEANAEKWAIANRFHHDAPEPGLSSARIESGIALWPGSTTRSADRISAGSADTTMSRSGRHGEAP